ncbi:hypothetical protein [Nonomuraea sp. NPDC049784]|uniref:hypothetical protein n=1 Tax=Nonomuraea sp. NPDC049784 TaxID=3154361 RepID=UPI0033ED91CB
MVVGAVVVQANSREVPVVAVGNSSNNTNGDGSGAGQPVDPPSTDAPPPAVPTGTVAPVPTLDVEQPSKTPKTTKPTHTQEPVSQVPNPVTNVPSSKPTTTRSEPKPTSTPTKKKTKSPTLIDPESLDTGGPSDSDSASTASTAPKPTTKPTSKPTAATKPNPYKATSVCGSGYKVIDSHALENATIYLLYNTSAGKNCVVTMSRLLWPGKVSMNAILQVKGGSSASNPGKFSAYAGPVRLPSKAKCVIWGGTFSTQSWKSGWSHCS